MNQDVISAEVGGNVSGNVLGNASGNAPSASSSLIFSLPLNDLGAGAVNTTPAIARGSATPTFTRATTAYTTLSSGLLAQVNSGVARSTYSADGSTYLGYLAEGSRTNLALWSRDLTNAAWTASNVTVAKTATGADGAANSASTLTATAGNGTVLQNLTRGSAQRVTGCYIKRRTGSGVINMTQDNGGTWTAVTVSAGWTLVSIPAATAANPIIGFRIVTNADAIDVDFVEHEEAAFISTPKPTTTASVTRNADVLTYASAGNFDNTVGTAYAEFSAEDVGSISNWQVLSSSGVGNAVIYFGTSSSVASNDGSTSVTASFSAVTANQIVKAATSWGGSSRVIAGNGTAGTAGAFDGSQNLTDIAIAGRTNLLFGTVRNVQIKNRALSAAQLQALTT